LFVVWHNGVAAIAILSTLLLNLSTINAITGIVVATP
jgi:hypothetical protein